MLAFPIRIAPEALRAATVGQSSFTGLLQAEEGHKKHFI
jgi:hypothetical protein